MVHTAYISVGSNMGRRAENCRQGITALAETDGIEVVCQSKLFLTEPVDYEKQRWFVNVTVKINTRLVPQALLSVLKEIERRAGREDQGIRFGPRVVDLDILFYEDLVLTSEKLVIPHPRMHKRRFVLQPLCDIDPDVRHPVYKKNIRQLYDMLEDTTQQVQVYE